MWQEAGGRRATCTIHDRFISTMKAYMGSQGVKKHIFNLHILWFENTSDYLLTLSVIAGTLAAVNSKQAGRRRRANVHHVTGMLGINTEKEPASLLIYVSLFNIVALFIYSLLFFFTQVSVLLNVIERKAVQKQ